MSPAVTTYKHDYINPREMGFSIRAPAPAAKQCSCQTDRQEDAVIASRLNQQCGATVEGLGKSEWTGVAPMGMLIKARIIQTPPGEPHEDDEQKCFTQKPNRFLQSLPNAYPTLFDDLQRMNRDDLAKVTNVDRLKTTYQVDYGGMAEYATGVYADDLVPEDEIMGSGMQDPCAECILTDCNKSRETKKKPFQHIRRTKVNCTHCTLHPDELSKNRRSEYTAKVGQIGELIMDLKLNDHSRCKTRCIHPISYSLLRG